MLQTTDGRRRSSRTLHAVVFGFLIVAAAASTLRQRAHSQEGAQDDIRIANNKDAAIRAFDAVRFPRNGPEPRPSIDLSYLSEAKHGLAAIRPKALFAREDMRSVTALIDTAIRQKLAEFGVDEAAAFSIAEVEQAMGSVVLEVLDANGGPVERGRLMVALSAVRSEKRLPVKKLLEATQPDTTTTEVANGTVIETPEPAIPAFGPMRHFALPDEHTVLPGISSEALTKLSERPESEQISAKPWFEIWQQVEQNMIAVVLDNSSGDWNAPWDDADLPEAKTLATHTECFALGCDLQGDKLNVQLIVQCRDADKSSEVVASLLAGLMQEAVRGLEKQSPTPNATAVQSSRARDERPAGETIDQEYLRSLCITVLEELASSKPVVEAGRVSLEASVDVDVPTVSALAAALAGDLGSTARSADASAK